MARKSAPYAQAPYGLCDAAFADLMREILAWDARRDVRATAAVLATWLLTRTWPASHYPKKQRDRWAAGARAAARISERELAELSGFGEWRTHTALAKMLDAGFVVELAPAAPRGEGRGTAPRTLALRCHAGGTPANVSDKSDSVSSISSISESTDKSRHAQAWKL